MKRLLAWLKAKRPSTALPAAEDPPDPDRLREWNSNRPRGVGLYGARLSRRGGVSPRATELECMLCSEAFAERHEETSRYLEIMQWSKGPRV